MLSGVSDTLFVLRRIKLDKEMTSYNDLLDAFRLSLQFYKRSKR